MKRDPFYQAILQGLSRPLDPDLFERCVADILRAEWPTLVPVRGGADAGMDGAVGDGSGTAFPLICTTGEDVIGNLTRSLASYVRNGGDRKVAILVTSRELTPGQRQNLEKRAKDKGFTLQQVYTRAAIADRLYRNAAWCRELLSLNGTPPALSVIPPTTRPLIDIPLIGRINDLEWLSSISGDRLLVGQPGCGKTFLLHELARSGAGLFVISHDRSQIAAELRSQSPHSLIVDDAHVDIALLKELLQLRRELGLSFDLIACSWPGERDEVSQVLNLPAPQVRALDLLTRDQILAVIRSVGIFGPDELLRELVDQAEGRPGLAVTLAHLCLHGGVREVALGDALSRSIGAAFGPLVGQHATELLAGFSVGGADGMGMQAVAQLFGLPLIQVRRDMARLAAGGVVQQLPEDRLTVRPEGLRHTLVRDLFFQTGLSVPVRPFIDAAPNPTEVARTLIGTRSRGGDVPDGLLVPLLDDLGSSSLWDEFASLGRQETAYVLRQVPAKIEAFAGPALHYMPEDALSRLLDAAINASMPSTARSLNLIQEWVRTAPPGQGDAIPRRRLVVRGVAAWLEKSSRAAGGPPDVTEKEVTEERLQIAVQAVASALSPCFERTTTDPGLGNTVTIARGVLTLDETSGMRQVWAEALDLLHRIPVLLWKPAVQALEDWAYPARHGFGETHDGLQNAMQQLARQMVGDLAPLTTGHPGLAASLNRVSQPLGFQPALSEDSDFAILFPVRPRQEWRLAEQEWKEAIGALADRWALHAAEDVAKRLISFGREADMAGLTWPRLTQHLCYDLASRVPAPKEWAQAFFDARLSANLTRPFLEQAVALREEGWEGLLRLLLNDTAQRAAAVLCILMLPVPPDDLLDEALAMSGDFTEIVNQVCLRNEIPAATARRLLQHEDVAVKAAAATGIWTADPQGVIPEELGQEWRSAILCIKHDDYWLGEILKADRVLTMDWLKARLADEDQYYFRLSDSFQGVISSLDEAERIGLLPLVPDGWGVGELLGWLVGDSPAVYAALLHMSHLHPHHLSPLGTFTDVRANVMTLQALDAGYDVPTVAAALIPSQWSWTGSVSAMWQQWIDRLDHLCQQNEGEPKDSRLIDVAQAARSIFQQYRDQAQAQEHTEAVYGRH